MIIDQSKAERQAGIARKWADANGKGGVKAPPGFGKTYLLINFIAKPLLDRKPDAVVQVIVHTTALRKQWLMNVQAFTPEYVHNIKVETIQAYQAKARSGRVYEECSLLVLDEMDEYFSDDRSKIWNGTWIKFKWLLWLSATPRDTMARDRNFYINYPAVDIVTIQEAQQKGWIDEFKSYCFATPFTEAEQEAFDENEVHLGNMLAKFDGNRDAMYACLAGHKGPKGYIPPATVCELFARKNNWRPEYEVYLNNPPKDATELQLDWIRNVVSMWNPKMVKAYAEQCNKALERRKMLLYNCKAKYDAILAIAEVIKRKTIVFALRTDFIDRVRQYLHEKGIKSVAVHSNVKSMPLRSDAFGRASFFGTFDWVRYSKGTQKAGHPKVFGKDNLTKIALEHYIQGDCDWLLVGKAFDKGYDVPEIGCGIIAANHRTSNQFIQRLGRTTRKSKHDFVFFINLYVPGTSDEWSLRSNIKELNHGDVYWIEDASELLLDHTENDDFFG